MIPLDRAVRGNPNERQMPGYPKQLQHDQEKRRNIQEPGAALPGYGVHRKTKAEMNKKSRKEEKSQNRESVNPPIQGAQLRSPAEQINDESSETDKVKMKGARQPGAPQKNKNADSQMKKAEQRAKAVPGSEQSLRSELDADAPDSLLAGQFIGNRGAGTCLI